ncbi:NF-kappa-B inhibitor cactus [Nasonia vitripennis]|uniref:Cactus n=1 Tax=Nasonia vitripennis TaxID=7425 RepID=A0A7M7LLT4_NASVI|nr:NF-kappa-B inhibitor cactus [Nasonia vitripennis]
MWSQEKSAAQTRKIESQISGQADSGFQSLADSCTASMRACSENAECELSETFIRTLSLKHANINNLDMGKSQHKSEPIVNANRLDCPWNEIDSDMLRNSYEFFYKQDSNGDTQLHTSITMNHVEASLWLINLAPHPCLLDIINDESHTALHLAVMIREPQIVRRLVLAGANTTVRTRGGNTPLHMACSHGDLDCARALTEPITKSEMNWTAGKPQFSPANLNMRNYTGKTCLHIAASRGHVEMVDHLLRVGADVNVQEGLGGKTALHLAIENGHRQVVHFLVRERRSCLEAVTYGGETPYQIALDVDRQLAEELLRFGASPVLRSDDSSSDSSSSSSMSEDDSDDCL